LPTTLAIVVISVIPSLFDHIWRSQRLIFHWEGNSNKKKRAIALFFIGGISLLRITQKPRKLMNLVVLLESHRAKPRFGFFFLSILKTEVFNMDKVYLASSNPLSRMLSSSRTFIAKLRSRFSKSSKASTGMAKILVGVDLAVIVPTKFV